TSAMRVTSLSKPVNSIVTHFHKADSVLKYTVAQGNQNRTSISRNNGFSYTTRISLTITPLLVCYSLYGNVVQSWSKERKFDVQFFLHFPNRPSSWKASTLFFLNSQSPHFFVYGSTNAISVHLLLEHSYNFLIS